LLVSDAVLKAAPIAVATPKPAPPIPESAEETGDNTETTAPAASDAEDAPEEDADKPPEAAAEGSPVKSALVQQVVDGAAEGTASLGLVEESTEALRVPEAGRSGDLRPFVGGGDEHPTHT
jgi:hypothetical protein